MKIVMLCDLYDDAAQYQENLLAKYYAKHGHEVVVVAATFDSTLDYTTNRYDRRAVGREYRDGDVKVIKRPYAFNILNRLRSLRGVDQILQSEQPDLIFLHDIHLNLPQAAAYKRAHPACRVVMDYHADYSNSAQSWISFHILHKLIRRSVLHRYRHMIDRVYPVVPASAQFLHEVYGLDLADLELLPLGADTDLARATRQARAGREVRRSYSIPDDAVVIFTGGKLTRAKRTNLLVEAMARLDYLDLHLFVVGDFQDGDPAYRQAFMEARARNPRVHMTGWVSGKDVYRFMDACDLAVFPASQSVLWQQALSMGLPLIVGRVGVQDCSYMNPYENIIMLDEPHIRADRIADRVREMVTNRERLAERQSAALRAADELLNYDKLILKTFGR